MEMKRQARWSCRLATVSLAALATAHLALTDIWHGEGDLGLEWRVLQAAGAIVLISQVLSIATLRRLLSER